ncbi:MAG: hypothetical protein ACOYOH_22240 [Paracraurococcus sp.]
MRTTAEQDDLFAAAAAEAPVAAPADFIARQRAELDALLALARGAARLPWPDYTQSALAELRFDGLARWLPPAEAAEKSAAFAAELDRLYAAEPQPAA